MAQVRSPRQRRRRGRVKWLSHYSSAQTILVVGDGDLSFSLALAAAFGSGDSLVATSLDSYEALTSKYGQAKSNIIELKRLGATVLHCVDAEMMKHHRCLKMRRFDRIVFNFPHAGFIGQENDDHMIKAHQLLVRSFFHNANHLRCPDGEIHVSHKKGQPYDRWKIEELASEFSLVMFDTVAFQKEHYPGYNQKRGDSDRCNEKFSLHNGYTFKFRVEREEVEECAQKGYPTHNLAIQSSQASPSKVVKQVWHAKSPRAEISESNKQDEKNTSADTIKIFTKELEIKELGKGPIVIGNPGNSNGGIAAVQQAPMANDHEARMSKGKPRDPKYTQTKWCPARLPKTKKMRSQRMRNQDKVEQEAEKQMDEFFNEIRPVVPSKQVWRPRQIENAAASTSITTTPISSKENNVAAITSHMPHSTVPSLEVIPKVAATLGDDEEMVDFEPTPVGEGMDINMVYYLPAKFRAIDEEGEVAQLDFGPKNAIFEKPKRPVKHLKQCWAPKCKALMQVDISPATTSPTARRPPVLPRLRYLPLRHGVDNVASPTGKHPATGGRGRAPRTCQSTGIMVVPGLSPALAGPWGLRLGFGVASDPPSPPNRMISYLGDVISSAVISRGE